MRTLIISDEIDSKSFDQILSLKMEIQGLCRNQVDLFVFSNKGILMNREQIGEETDNAIEILKKLLGETTYDLIVISLKLVNLRRLFPEKRNVLNMIEMNSPQTSIFLFGASSILDKLKEKRIKNVFLYSRPGVSKLTREFRNDVIDYIKTKKSENQSFSFSVSSSFF